MPSKEPPITVAISNAIKQRLLKVKRDYKYCKILQRAYEITKQGGNVIEWKEGGELIRVGI